ncbi:MAG: hypothetical protein DMF93_20870 [Acidobacteria bacterium]|nr:MAG: hypothetical protein DMF93_20870 [Acidobacteriota bacterium]
MPVCPKCTRRAPATVSMCRCGHAFDPVEETPAAANVSSLYEPEPRKSPPMFVVAAVLGAALIGSLYWSNRSDAPRARVEAPASRPAAPETPQPRHAAPAPDGASPAAAPAAAMSLEDLVTRLSPAVVLIQSSAGRGSGFFVAPDTILTNVHVVGSDSSLTIRRADGSTTTARVDASAPAFDIAVLRVSNPNADQATIRMGSVATTRVGEDVIAIGTPLGFLQNTVSRGIVSALREADGSTLIQTDAAINPGNSGGPLLDRTGTAIGIIRAGYNGRDGLSFAVAIDHAKAVLDGRLTPAPAASGASQQYHVLAPTVASPADQQRNDATKEYERLIAQFARRANALDDEWRTFMHSCYEGKIAGAFDHQWFALWEPKAMQGAVSPGCGAIFSGIRREAQDIQQGVIAAEELARRNDVYPGSRRELLRRYRLDYAGWDR